MIERFGYIFKIKNIPALERVYSQTLSGYRSMRSGKTVYTRSNYDFQRTVLFVILYLKYYSTAHYSIVKVTI